MNDIFIFIITISHIKSIYIIDNKHALLYGRFKSTIIGRQGSLWDGKCIKQLHLFSYKSESNKMSGFWTICIHTRFLKKFYA